MSELPATPAKPEPTDAKGDKAEAKDSFALPKSQQLSTSQQVFIWGLVLFVGILFGAGPITDTLLGNTNRVQYVGNVSENDILARQGVARRLQDALNPQRDPSGGQFEPSSYDRYGRQVNTYEVWAERIQLARYAETQGLLPGGAALDAIVKEFLNKPLSGNSGKRYVDALKDVEGGAKGVTLDQLKRHLAEERARELVSMAKVVAPAVPLVMSDAVSALLPLNQMDYYTGRKGDQVVVDEVVLSAKHLLAEVKDDDAEIQQKYDTLKSSRFARPAAVEVSVAYVDVPALAAKTAVPDANIEAYYNAHKDEFRKPVEAPKPEEKKPDEKKPEEQKADAPKDGEAKPEEKKADEKKEEPKIEYKPLAEVSAQIKDKLARELAASAAKEKVRQFDVAIEELTTDKDNVRFKAKAAEFGLNVREKVFIEEPKAGGSLNAGEFGMLSESQLHLFNQELNFITSAVESTGEHAAWLVLRVDGRREAGFNELSDPAVKKQVKDVLAGERAYKALLAKAEEIRAEAEKAGPGGLKKWAESDAAKPWETKVESKTETVFDVRYRQLNEIRSPAPDIGMPVGTNGKALIELAMPARPVVLGDSPAQADVPAVRLVQATAYLAAAPAAGATQVERASTYRDMLENYRAMLLQRELAAELQKN
jgi:hypothetical protein